MIEQIRGALALGDVPESESNVSALMELLAQAMKRLQDDLRVLNHTPNHTDTRMNIGSTSIRVTTSKETIFDRALEALFKTRVSFD